MNKEEFLKAIENVPKIDSINTISAYNSINIEDLANAVDRFKKIPTYDELLKENKELKEVINKAIEYIKERFYFNEETGEYSLLHTFDKDNIKELLDILKEMSE